jgi:FtsP/CotA-like multicopper oxidase with cupredoxin domain
VIVHAARYARLMSPHRAVWGLLLAAACGGDEAASTPLDVAMTVARDIHPDPDIVEVALSAEPGVVSFGGGVDTAVWGYRDAAVDGSAVTVPGPMIEAKRGDTLIVHFFNGLDDGTTLHHHGPRLPNTMDGAPMGAGLVLPGESFDFTFRLDDASTFWYHPHWRTDEQMELGLYGQLVVHGSSADVARERFFMLDDVDLADDGGMILEPDEFDVLLGRRGDTLLVNGQASPAISVIAGTRERWHFTNASNGRYYALSLASHGFTVIGSDGGLLDDPYTTTTLTIAPGERYDVLVEITGDVGATLELMTTHVDRGMGEPVEPDQRVLAMRIDGRQSTASVAPIAIGVIEPIETGASTVVRTLSLGFDPDPIAGTAPAYTINDERFPFAPPIVGTVGDVEIWEIVNATPTQEPFHLHGTFFQVLDRDGVAEPRLAQKDVVSVAAGTTLRFAVRYERAGMWMFHSHIPEHAERGMMRVLQLD